MAGPREQHHDLGGHASPASIATDGAGRAVGERAADVPGAGDTPLDVTTRGAGPGNPTRCRNLHDISHDPPRFLSFGGGFYSTYRRPRTEYASLPRPVPRARPMAGLRPPPCLLYRGAGTPRRRRERFQLEVAGGRGTYAQRCSLAFAVGRARMGRSPRRR